MIEEWKNIEENPNYWVSNKGRFYNRKHNRFLKVDYNGRINLNSKGYSAKKIVAKYFMTTKPGFTYICNKGDQRIPSIENLFFTNLKGYNIWRGIRTKRRINSAKIIDCMGREYKNARTAANENNIDLSNLYKVLRGCRKSVNGLTFNYIGRNK